MKLIFKTLLFTLLISAHAHAQQALPTEFTDLLKRNKMKFEFPSLYKIVPTVDNPHMNTDLAIEFPLEEMEVRYAIHPLDNYIKEYKAYKKRKNPNESMADPNILARPFLTASILNISGEFVDYQEFPATSVKNEFNADWGATTMVIARPEFGQQYKYCLIIALHKDNVGDAYIFFLAKDNEVISRNLMTAFHSLKFK